MKFKSGSTAQLLLLCAGYFIAYVIYAMSSKYFTDILKMPQFNYLYNNTVSSSAICVVIVLVLGWILLLAKNSNRLVNIAGFKIPHEVGLIAISGICTAIVIPATTLLYTIGISVMVAQVIMRGTVIFISRIVDAIQIKKGLLKKTVYREENIAVVFALLAVASVLLLFPVAVFLNSHGTTIPKWLGVNLSRDAHPFVFVENTLAMTILILYTLAYAVRLYIMNWYKNTRQPGKTDNRGYFAVEQLSASLMMVIIGAFFFFAPLLFGWQPEQVIDWRGAVLHPDFAAIMSGIPYAAVAFFSVFLFMFKGRTATFAGLANRLTSLLAGILATLLLWRFFGLAFPSAADWIAVLFVMIAVYYMRRAEKKRMAEHSI
jgi:hypothetical protein